MKDSLLQTKSLSFAFTRNIPDMGFEGCFCDAKGFRNCRSIDSFAQKGQDFLFAWCQEIFFKKRKSITKEAIHQPGGKARFDQERIFATVKEGVQKFS